MLWTGYGFMAFAADQVSAAIRYPMWIRNAALPVAGAFICIHALALLLKPSLLNELREENNG